MNIPRQCFSMCEPQTISTCIIWEHVRNVYSQALLRTTESVACALTRSPGDSDTGWSLRTTVVILCCLEGGPWISRSPWTLIRNVGHQGVRIRTCILTRYPGDPYAYYNLTTTDLRVKLGNLPLGECPLFGGILDAVRMDLNRYFTLHRILPLCSLWNKKGGRDV